LTRRLLTTQVCCGTVSEVTAALYEDAGLLLDENGITIRRYYFPMGAYTDIQGVKSEPMTRLSGKGRFWGASDPRYWFPLDLRRGGKPSLPILDVGARVKSCITPEDPDRVLELLRARVPVS
jgi:hypothetical protein